MADEKPVPTPGKGLTPITCPGCKSAQALNRKPHCEKRVCGWHICLACGTVYNFRTGRHYTP